MKIFVRSLTNQKYELDVEPSDSVAHVKQLIHERHNLGEPDLQKLIFSGKILADEQTLDDAKVKEGGFIVLMIKKEKAPPAAAVKKPEPAATPVQPSAAAAQPQAQPAAAAAPAAAPSASALVTVRHTRCIHNTLI
jgi:UV excision repair protein RAD23